MAYEPTNWQAGDVVTSAKLNKMEQGIAKDDVIEVILEDYNASNVTLSKTWQEIWDNNYTSIMFTLNDNSVKSFMPIQALQINEGTYIVRAGYGAGEAIRNFTCNSPDAYPSYETQDAG